MRGKSAASGFCSGLWAYLKTSQANSMIVLDAAALLLNKLRGFWNFQDASS